MSREYLLHVNFDKSYRVKDLKKFFIEWCGKEQIYEISPDYVVCEMGCSSGIAPKETLESLYEQLNEAGFKVERHYVRCWSLHQDDAITKRR